MNFYTSVFRNSRILSIKRYPEGPLEDPIKGMEGKVLTGIFELEGQKFMALDGGPIFKFNPSISFTVKCKTIEEVDELYKKLSEGGNILMALDKYPWSDRYAWISDKYGLSWQLMRTREEFTQKITSLLMFTGEKFGKAEEAINYYASIFPNSKINLIARYQEGEGDEPGKIAHSSFLLEGEEFMAMESSHEHKFGFNEAISLMISCETQEEIDYFWEKLTAGGDPKAQQCGWLKDKYGVSWQIIPKILGDLMQDPDKEKSGRVFKAMLKMKKIDIENLKKAAL